MMNSQQVHLPCIPTCLSPSVHSLVTEKTQSADMDMDAVDKNGFLDFTCICRKLPAPIETNSFTGSQEEYFHCCVKALAPIFHSVEDSMQQRSETELSRNYDNFLTWTGQEKVLLELWEKMYEDEAVSDLLVLLVTSAILERSLGDMYLTKGPSPCPSMLKDLLVTPELQAILGQNVVLRVLIGPPVSLNLRNIAWHGFPFPGEIPRRCIWFIICMVPSIGKLLHEKGLHTILHREPVKLPKMCNPSGVNLSNNPNNWLKLLTKSKLVSWNTEVFWQKIVHYYRKDRSKCSIYHNGFKKWLLQRRRKVYLWRKGFSLCAALLLYCLEQGLRGVFATINNCQQRILTAEATTLFTTFDETVMRQLLQELSHLGLHYLQILSPYLPDGSNNSIQHVLGTQVMEILMDLLMYQEGPRLRDRLSHGELDWTGPGIPRETVDSLFVITVHICALFIPQENNLKTEELEKISQDISEYRVQFHRISLIQNMIIENADIVCGIDGLVCVLPDLSRRDPNVLYPISEIHVGIQTDIAQVTSSIVQNWSVFTVDGEVMNSLTYSSCNEFRRLLDTIISHKISTLYREAKLQKGAGDAGQVDRDGELLSVLQHIITECSCVLSHVSSCVTTRQQQLENKELRSRQRENLKKFLSCFPSFVLVTNVCSLLVIWQLYHLESPNTHDDSFMKSRIKFWKTVLQFGENLRTCTHPDKNKWTDGLDLIAKFVKSVSDSFEIKLVAKSR